MRLRRPLAVLCDPVGAGQAGTPKAFYVIARGRRTCIRIPLNDTLSARREVLEQLLSAPRDLLVMDVIRPRASGEGVALESLEGRIGRPDSNSAGRSGDGTHLAS